MGLFTVPTVLFEVLFVFVILAHDRRFIAGRGASGARDRSAERPRYPGVGSGPVQARLLARPFRSSLSCDEVFGMDKRWPCPPVYSGRGFRPVHHDPLRPTPRWRRYFPVQDHVNLAVHDCGAHASASTWSSRAPKSGLTPRTCPSSGAAQARCRARHWRRQGAALGWLRGALHRLLVVHGDSAITDIAHGVLDDCVRRHHDRLGEQGAVVIRSLLRRELATPLQSTPNSPCGPTPSPATLWSTGRTRRPPAPIPLPI